MAASVSSRAKRWCFTLNNWTQPEYDALSVASSDASARVVYLIFGKETGESGTPHLQGYVEFQAAVRFTTVKNRLGLQRAHLQVARGSPQQNRDYCSKDGDYEEFGSFEPAQQGRRSDLEGFYEWADTFAEEKGRPPTTPEIAKEHPTIITRYRNIREIVQLRVGRRLFHPDPEPRAWQQSLADKLNEGASDRKIIFVVDPDGNSGKSWFCRWWYDQHPDCTQLMSIGRAQDIAHSVKVQTQYFLFDIPRGGLQFLQKQVLESLKNRWIYSPKYSSTYKELWCVPHVVVFSNEHPSDVEGFEFTPDRYEWHNVV